MATKRQKVEDAVIKCDNFIGNSFKPPSTGKYMDVISPVDGKKIGICAVSDKQDVLDAITEAKKALPGWQSMTMKARASIMYKFKTLMDMHADELADLVVKDNGKNKAEALASVAKGNETVEWACSMPNLCVNTSMQVSRGVDCKEIREPLGIVASVVPFNFPVMVPMWTVPIALTAGNCVILKPSEKVPLAIRRIAELMKEAGFPAGVFQTVNGCETVVNELCDNSDIKALSFVGSSRVAEIVAKRCQAIGKQVLALGGAKNHLLALPDAHKVEAAKDIVASFAGCAGQRCMAASVLILVGDGGGAAGETDELLDQIVELAAKLQPGNAAGEVGAIIDDVSKARILKYIAAAKASSDTKVLLDGSSWSQRKGCWVGPTILLHSNRESPALTDEIFGPVLSVLKVDSWDEALEVENSSEYGNAASIYTSSGGNAEYFCARFKAGMIGVNIGVPVPREPMSFGGSWGTKSKFGCSLDITGPGAFELFTRKIKVTSRWPMTVGGGKPPAGSSSSSSSLENGATKVSADAHHDAGSFVGKM